MPIDWKTSICCFPNCLDGVHVYDTEYAEFHCYKHYLQSAYRLNVKRGNVVFRGTERESGSRSRGQPPGPQVTPDADQTTTVCG